MWESVFGKVHLGVFLSNWGRRFLLLSNKKPTRRNPVVGNVGRFDRCFAEDVVLSELFSSSVVGPKWVPIFSGNDPFQRQIVRVWVSKLEATFFEFGACIFSTRIDADLFGDWKKAFRQLDPNVVWVIVEKNV